MASVSDFVRPYYGLSNLSGVVGLLVILWDPHRPDHPAPSKAKINSLIFGATSSLQAWFSENSLGRFMVERKALLGWYDAIHPWEFYWRAGLYEPSSDPSDSHYFVDPSGNVRYLDEKGFYDGHAHSWMEAIREANKEFNYAPYDADGDDAVDNKELSILIIKPQSNPFGTNRPVVGRQVPPEDLIVDGVKVSWMSEVYIGQSLNLGVVVHELCHQVFPGADMYLSSNSRIERRAGAYSIMDISYRPFHLDPYHKLKLGWLNPQLVEGSGWYTLQDVETTGEALILHDPRYSSSEFFIVENRWPGTSFDQGLPGIGLAVWHVIESPLLKDDWGRKAVSLRRANGGMPVNDAMALFSASSPELGYDLDDDSVPQNLRFQNNRRSGIRIAGIPTASKSMTFYVYVPPVQSQLLSYGDEGTPGNVSSPVTVGFGGWLNFKFVFAGGNLVDVNRIYAVNQSGQLLSYGDNGTLGNVSSPVVVGFGGWLDFKFILAGRSRVGTGRIYAVDQSGQLLSYEDTGTPGNVSSPVVVGFGGWSDFKFIFAGRNIAGADRIYAVNQSGQLLSYEDTGAPGNVSNPVVVGFGGWLDFKFIFTGKNRSGAGRIYAVDHSGQLLSYEDTGTPGNVSSPVVVGFGGWSDFKFLFAGKNLAGADCIYAVVA